MERITITRPDDWHVHFRDGEHMHAVLPHTAERFARAIVMPNLRPPVTTTAAAGAYRERILRALPGLEEPKKDGRYAVACVRARDIWGFDEDLLTGHGALPAATTSGIPLAGAHRH